MEADFASLCVLSYERPDYLVEGVSQIRELSHYPYELIIHDDGSKPDFDKQNTIEDHLRNFKWGGATIIENLPGWNQGQGVALNRMFNMAKGDPIIKLDQDLTYHLAWLLEVVRIMKEHESIGLLGLLHYYHEPVDSRNTVVERFDEYSTHTHILGSGFAVRRACWEELGPFSEHSDAFAEDWEFQIKVATSKKWKVALAKENLVENPHMGIPHSTIVKDDGKSVTKIHKTPYIISPSVVES